MKTPNKIRLESLTEKNGLYCWAEKPFTGIAFKALAENELAPVVIEAGKVESGKKYVPAYFDCPENLPLLDISDYVLNDTYGSGSYYITHHEQPFTGLAFDFLISNERQPSGSSAWGVAGSLRWRSRAADA